MGKGPLTETLEIYLKACNKKLAKHVLYNTRELKENETQGKTYWYTFMWDKAKGAWSNGNITYDRNKAGENLDDIAAKAKEKSERFETFEVGSDRQGLNYSVLKKELDDNAVVVLEIYQKKVYEVTEFCKKEGFDVTRIFVSPLSDKDYTDLGCYGDEHRYFTTTATMLVKLRSRARDSEEDILKRAKRAHGEMEEASILRDENKLHILVNPFGEGVKEWKELQERVGNKLEYRKYGAQVFTLTEDIDKMFRQFLALIFSRIPKLVDEEKLAALLPDKYVL